MFIRKVLARSIMKGAVRFCHKNRPMTEERREGQKIFDAVTKAKTPEEYWKMRNES